MRRILIIDGTTGGPWDPLGEQLRTAVAESGAWAPRLLAVGGAIDESSFSTLLRVTRELVTDLALAQRRLLVIVISAPNLLASYVRALLATNLRHRVYLAWVARNFGIPIHPDLAVLLRAVDEVISESTVEATALARTGHPRIKCLPPCVPASAGNDEARILVRKALGLDGEVLVLSCVSADHRAGLAMHIFAAFATAHPTATLYVHEIDGAHGDRLDLVEVRRWLDLDNHVLVYPDVVARNIDALQLALAADIHLVVHDKPSIPPALLWSVSAGIATIAPRFGAITELVGDGVHLVPIRTRSIEPGGQLRVYQDVSATVSALATLTTEKGTREAVARAGRTAVADLTWERMAPRWLDELSHIDLGRMQSGVHRQMFARLARRKNAGRGEGST